MKYAPWKFSSFSPITLKMVPWLSLATLHFSRITQSSLGVPFVVVVVDGSAVVVTSVVVGSVNRNSGVGVVSAVVAFFVKWNSRVVVVSVVVVVLAVVVKSLKRDAVVRFSSSTLLEI